MTIPLVALAFLGCAAGDADTARLEEHVDEGVTLAEVQTCAAPAPTPTYTESGAEWGLQPPENTIAQHEESPSIAAGDVDGDGLDDLIIVNTNGKSHQYHHLGTGFGVTDITPLMASNLGILLYDLDGDGDLDLMMGGESPSSLTNQGGLFARGTPFPILPSSNAAEAILVHDFAPGDRDGDGILEFYLPLTYNFGDFEDQYNDIVMAGANATWTYDAEAVPTEVGLGHGIDALWFDANDDGDQDLYLVNDFGMLQGHSTLLSNDQGTLTSAEEACYCSALFNAKGIDVDDYNGDGRVDLYVSANPTNVLFEQLDDGTWVDMSVTTNASAVDTDATGWGGLFLDYDNDGQRDLFVAQGDRWNERVDHPHVEVAVKLLRQESGAFSDVAPGMGMTQLGSYRAALVLDFNADGVEDLLATQIEDRPLLYLSDGCTAAAWVEVEAPLGSKVRIEAGGRTQTNWVKSDAGYASHRPLRVHFGLGSASVIDRLTVTLPDGTTLGATAVEARRRITVLP